MTFGNFQSFGAFVIEEGSSTKAYVLTCANENPTTSSLRELNIENNSIGSALTTFNHVFMGASVPYNVVSTNMVCGTLGLNSNNTNSPYIKTNNPVSSNQNLEINTNIDIETISIIKLYDITGKQIKTFEYKKSSEINISDISSGNYILEFNFINGEKIKQKLIIE